MFGSTTTINVNINLSPALEALVSKVLSDSNATLNRIELKLDAAFLQETKHMAAIDDAVQSLTDQVAANTTVTGSVKTFLTGVPQMIADAVAKATAAGATPAQLKPFTDLTAALKANTDDLAAALVAGTPAVNIP